MLVSISPQPIYRITLIPIKIPTIFIKELEKKNSKYVWNPKRPYITKENLAKKNKLEGSYIQILKYTTKS